MRVKSKERREALFMVLIKFEDVQRCRVCTFQSQSQHIEEKGK